MTRQEQEVEKELKKIKTNEETIAEMAKIIEELKCASVKKEQDRAVNDKQVDD